MILRFRAFPVHHRSVWQPGWIDSFILLFIEEFETERVLAFVQVNDLTITLEAAALIMGSVMYCLLPLMLALPALPPDHGARFCNYVVWSQVIVSCGMPVYGYFRI